MTSIIKCIYFLRKYRKPPVNNVNEMETSVKSTCKAHAKGQNAKQVRVPTSTKFHALDMRFRGAESWKLV